MSEQQTLAELVRQRQQDGYSLREMEKRARDRGWSISHSQLADYGSGTVRKMPTGDQIEAIAAALDLGLDVVRAAALQQYWGYVPRELRGRRSAKWVAAVPADLTAEEEAELGRMIVAWAAARKGESDPKS